MSAATATINDSFSDHFDPWFQPEVRMIQPSVRPTIGKRAFREEFARPLFGLVADLHVAGSPRSWPKFLQTQLRSLRRPA